MDSTLDFEGRDGVEQQLKEMSEHLVNVRLDIRQLTTEIRSLQALQESVGKHETRLIQVEDKATALHKRVDKIDKVIFWFATSVGGTVILAVMSLVLRPR